MTCQTLNIGFIGAGSIARSRHLPGLAKIAGVKVVAVSNRSRESADKIAKEFDIPHVVDDWRRLIERDDIEAVFIGTWPYMHKDMSIAALQAGKHVFCQARMAMDLDEAKQMLACAEAHPRQVAMLCPPPHRMPFEPYIRQLLASNELGTITSIELVSVGGGNLNRNDVHWRERVEFSGRQILAMGIYAETLNAWFGEYETLAAMTSTPIASKRDASGKDVNIQVPQVVSIIGRLAGGAIVHEYHTGVVTDKTTPGDYIIIHGLAGTLRHRFFSGVIELARPGQPLEPVNVSVLLQRDWFVEQDFVDAVRLARQGKPWSVSPDFREGLAYMRKVEAVHLAAATGKNVTLATL